MKKQLSAFLVAVLALCLIPFSGCTGEVKTPDPDPFTAESLIIADQAANMPSAPYEVQRLTRDTEVPMGKEDSWTLFYYMCGSDLESKGGTASGVLIDLMKEPPSENVTIIVQTGGSKSWGAGNNPDITDKDLIERTGTEGIDPGKLQRYELTDTLTLVEELDLASMDDPDTLYGFLSWGVKNYPADKMGVILYDHGGGSLSGVCFDELFDKKGLSPADLDYAFTRLYPEMTDRFEFVQYSTCLSSTVEMADAIVPHARYMIASSEVSIDTDESVTTRTLNSRPECTGGELGVAYCDSYRGFFTPAGDEGAGSHVETLTFSVVDLSKIDAVLYALNNISAAFNDGREGEAHLADIASAVYHSENFFNPTMIDLGDFAAHCAEFLPAEAATLEAAVNDAVIYQVKGANHPSASGLAFYYPMVVKNKSVTQFALCPEPPEYKRFASYIEKRCIEQANSGEALIGAVGKPKTGDGNAISLDLEPADIDKVIDLGYEVYAVQEGTDDLIFLGYDTELAYNEATGSIHALFTGRWPTLEGQPLMIDLVDETEDYVTYQAPIKLNGERSNLMIRWVWQAEGGHTGHYEIMGTWGGTDEAGAFARDLQALNIGDTVAPLYTVVNKDALMKAHSIHRVEGAHDEVGMLIYEEGEGIEVGKEAAVSQEKLDEGEYLYQIVAVDYLMGKSAFTPMKYRISAEGDLAWIEQAQ